jgi:UvrD-like helicase family protein
VVDVDLLAVDRGTVTAPAGCGKTHEIAEALGRHIGSKPILVLTHTNAGVAALRARLEDGSVLRRGYRLSTIDGWAMRLIRTFPLRSGHQPNLLDLRNPGTDYPQIRIAANGLLKAGHLNDILASSYARLIVDEYQDCSASQHLLIAYAAQVLPTCVLGDPMQAIFGFRGDALAKWSDVCRDFPIAGELTTPWRWINAGSEAFGRWLLDVRHRLANSQPVDLRTAPTGTVTWVALDGTQDYSRQLVAARAMAATPDGCVLIIGDSARSESRRQFASQIPGANMVEGMDLKELVSFASELDLGASNALDRVVAFAQNVMTNVQGRHLLQRVQSLTRRSARTPPTDVEKAAMAFARAPSYRGAGTLLTQISKADSVRTYRHSLLQVCARALRVCAADDCTTFHDAAVRMREENRLIGRPLPRRAVGSTLLLKGLQAEVAVVFNADGLNARNLYVAMTRASTRLTVCSRSPILRPKP